MIKAFIRLFTSGALLKPIFIIGIVFGTILHNFLDLKGVFELFQSYIIYITIFFFVGLYVFFYKKVYKENNRDLNFVEMGMMTLGIGAKFLLTTFFTVIFYYMVQMMFI